MMNNKKTIVLCITVFILYVTLTSPRILPSVTIPHFEALAIVVFVAVSSLIIRFLSMIEAKKLEKKMLNQYFQMKTIIDNAPFMIYLKKNDGKILIANKRLSDILKIDKNLLVGQNAYDLYKEPQKCIQEDNEIVKNKSCINKERMVETVNSSLGWCRIIKAPVFDENGNVDSIVVIFHNIDAEKELEDRKDTFFATLTHDLKTPTIAQIKALDLLLRGSLGSLNDEQKDMVVQIKNSCKYMYDLIFTILDTYMYDSGQTKIQYSKFNIKELINETVSEISNLLKEKEQNIIIKSKLCSDEITADRFQIKRVIINFVANAIKYGNKKSDIEVIIEENDTDITVKIKNHSKMIPEVQIKNIYEKFQTSSGSKFGKSGTGLGLYLSKQIIDAHNGVVSATSDAGGVCVFGFSLPKPVKKNHVNAQ